VKAIIRDTVQSLETVRELRKIIYQLANLSTQLLDAERSTIFLHDKESSELISYIAHKTQEIRIPENYGVAGYSFVKQVTTNIEDALNDSRYNSDNDEKYGYSCKTILTEPVRSDKGEVIGVFQVINKKGKCFTTEDIFLLRQITSTAASLLIKAVEFDKSTSIDDKEMERITPLLSEDDISVMDDVKKATIPLYISNKPDEADLYFDYDDLELQIYNFKNEYYVISKNNANKIYVGSQQLKKDKPVRLDFDSDLTINEYEISRQQLRVYIKTKLNPFKKRIVYLVKEGSDIVFREKCSKKPLVEIELDRSKILLKQIESSNSLIVNGEKIFNDIYVNLNDDISLDGRIVNIRRIVYEQLLEKQTYLLDSESKEFKISNKGDGDISVNFNLHTDWEIIIYREGEDYYIDATNSPFNVYLNEKKVKKNILLEEDEIHFVNKVVTIDRSLNRLEMFNYNFRSMELKNVLYSFGDGTIGVDNISVKFDYGEFIAVIGPSGSGKSTLIDLIAGTLKPTKGSIVIDKHDLFENYFFFSNHISHVPQDDLLYQNLTVFENLYYNALLRYPGTKKRDIKILVNKVLREIRLTDKQGLKVGSPTDKILSGGERKRLNIGLELLSNSEIFILDEPTSGLSSKDSELVINILQGLSASGKIVITVIHQPSSKIFKKFDSVLLLDKGGKLAYYGEVESALKYFLSHKRSLNSSINRDRKNIDPEIILEVMEENKRDEHGGVTDRRLHTPEYWQSEYKRYIKDKGFIKFPTRSLDFEPKKRNISFSDKISQFSTLFKRNFVNKLKNRSNLMITFLEAPLLAICISLLLKFTPDGSYSLYDNRYLTTFFFLSTIVSLFLALANSIDEVIVDRDVLSRERLLNIRSYSYYTSKFVTLLLFSLVQNFLYLKTSYIILEIKELFFYHFIYLTTLSTTGIGMGLLVSSIPGLKEKTVQNFLPLILIPQIIFGGHIVKYEDMSNLFRVDKTREIPEVCDFMPSRWGFEGMVTLHYSNSQYFKTYEKLKSDLQAAIDREERESVSLQDRKSEILSKMNSFRKEYKRDYGNMVLEEEIKDALAKKRDEATYHDIMFYPKKDIFFLKDGLRTEIFNLFILLSITLFNSIVTIATLSSTERLKQRFSRFKLIRKS
jgi:ABC-type multidrug transport system ATPase subunit/pSer/pThr/pTyr-binding forkhead associated (FHA) protein